VSEAVAEELSRLGVRTAFALMSEEVAQLIVELERAGMRLLTSRHEAGAVGMADGFGRATDWPALAVIGRGPGLSNAMTALTTAARHRTPLLVLVGAPPSGARPDREIKHIEQETMLSGAGIAQVKLGDPARIHANLAAAHARAARGETVVVSLPVDILEAEVADAGDRPMSLPLPPAAETPLDLEAITLVADLLAETWAAGRTVILAGRGAVQSGARAQLVGLADRTGSLLGTTLMANSFFAGHPFDVGVVGSFSPPGVGELVRNADLILAFGAALNPFTTYGGSLFGKARVAQFDVSASAFGRFLEPDIAVLGDARSAAEALFGELERRGHHSGGYRQPEVAGRIAHARADLDFADQSRAGAIDPRALMRALDGVLPADRNLVVDPGHHLTFSCSHVRVASPDRFFFPVDYGAVGSALPIALGVAAARPDSTTVLAVGDGGLMMALAELQTAARYGLRLVVVVSNDSAFGAEVHYLQALRLPDELARYENPSFEELGRALGLDAVTVTSVEDVQGLAARLANVDLPLLLDCRIAGEVRADWIDFYYLGKS
jgi:thiamine pyrophosphate-dependent acetolactate synthase large subunit-like protein